MTNVYLCDDDSDTTAKYIQLVAKAAEKHKVEIVISSFNSGERLLFQLIDSPDLADIIYLDILMGQTNGIDVAKRLRAHGCKAEFIFLTTSEEYVYDAFDVFPVQYLLKDSTTEEKFEDVFLKSVALSQKRMQNMFVFESVGGAKIIPISEISYFEIWKRIVEVHYGGRETMKFYQSLEKLQEGLKSNDFIRIHRSYIVHLTYIVKFERQNVILKSGERLPIGGTYSKSVKEAFSEYAIRSRNLRFIK